MRTNEEGLQIIRDSEGLELEAYICPAGRVTIGYGHTGPDVMRGDTITEEIAERLLRQDVEAAERIVEKAVRVKLNDNQFSALASFVFNVGPGKYGVKSGFVTLIGGGPSTMLRLLNQGSYMLAAKEFPKWVRGGGAVLPGLVTRRQKEQALFLKPVPVS